MASSRSEMEDQEGAYLDRPHSFSSSSFWDTYISPGIVQIVLGRGFRTWGLCGLPHKPTLHWPEQLVEVLLDALGPMSRSPVVLDGEVVVATAICSVPNLPSQLLQPG